MDNLIKVLAVVGVLALLPFALGLVLIVGKIFVGLALGLTGAFIGIVSAILAIGLAFVAIAGALAAVVAKRLLVPIVLIGGVYLIWKLFNEK